MQLDDVPQEKPFSENVQNILNVFAKCKHDFTNEKDECSRLRECNRRLENELQELREVEKSLRFSNTTSQEIISSLQESVSNLAPFKRDIRKLTTEIENRDKNIASLQEDKIRLMKMHEDEKLNLIQRHETRVQRVIEEIEAKMKTAEREFDTRLTLFTCEIAELNSKIAELHDEHKEKMNMIVLEYEEKLQRSAAQLTQLQDQHTGLVARTDASIDVYRRKLADMEDKIKQNDFKQFAMRGPMIPRTPSPFVPPPSPHREDIAQPERVYMNQRPSCSNKQKARSVNPLPVTQIPVNRDEKKQFSMVKKRKLYNDKEYQ